MYSRIYVKGKQLFYRPDGNRTEASEHAHITSFRLLTSWCGFWIVPVCKAYTSSTRSFWVRQTTSWSLQKHAVICMLATEEVMQDYLQETENHPLRLFNFHIVRWLTCPTETADTCNFICLEITHFQGLCVAEVTRRSCKQRHLLTSSDWIIGEQNCEKKSKREELL